MIELSEAFKKNHPGLAARLRGIATSLFGDVPVKVCDASEEVPASARAVRVGQSDHAAQLRECPYLYDEPQSELALAGLLARIASIGGRSPIAADPHTLSVFALAERLAQTNVPALITGPTGTGKEVMSRYIHDRSTRANKSFVAINCAAIPDTMLEALLFGHEKGAFTGASTSGVGLFREADGGTLLLDEIAEMPLALQSKLLRALQEGEVLPVGATRPVKVDVRIIACANRDLPTEVAEGRLREDLYYRLNVFPIQLGALREREDDIAPLACALFLRHAEPGAATERLSPAAISLLKSHNWPGNVRELENVVRRALILASDQKEIGPEHIVFDATARLGTIRAMESEQICGESEPASQADGSSGTLSKIVQLSEARAILDAIKECGGKKIEAARRLGISERTLRYRLASFRDAGIDMGAAL